MLPSLEADAALRELVDEYRDRCLWFLRRDYYPATAEEAQGVLDSIQRHGNRDGFRRAAQIRQWLSLAPRLSRDIDLFHDTEAARLPRLGRVREGPRLQPDRHPRAGRPVGPLLRDRAPGAGLRG